jgi:F420-dependent oxidoreductase-like protein
MQICLMIEGQEGVTWPQWLGLADACERHGLAGLFRSDHYTSVMGVAGRGSLDAWATLAALAARTSRIRLGTLVSPVTFRHPSVLAKNVVTVDQVSGGRAELGIGAGWQEHEHRTYGFPMPPLPVRLSLLTEQLEIVTRSFAESGFSFAGSHYRVEDLDAEPKPVQRPRPTVLVGGSGRPRSLALAARYADEYNTVSASVDEVRGLRGRLEAAWRDAGRDPASARLSLMTGCVVASDRGELLERVGRVLAVIGSDERPQDALAGRAERWVVGTVDQVVERLGALAAAGLDRVMLQHLAHDDLEMVALLGRTVAPALARAGG